MGNLIKIVIMFKYHKKYQIRLDEVGYTPVQIYYSLIVYLNKQEDPSETINLSLEGQRQDLRLF